MEGNNEREDMLNKLLPKGMKEKLQSRGQLIEDIMKACDGYPIFEIKICLKMAEDRIGEKTRYINIDES